MSLNPINALLDTGSAAFAPWWTGWLSQYTQPQLLREAEEYLGARLFHSSQMGGFRTRKLRDPAPRVFLAVGYLNVAHGHSLGIAPDRIEEVPDIGLPKKLPESLRGIWEGREPLCDAFGVVVGPVGLFEAFTGLRAVPVRIDRRIAPEDEAAACQELGRYLRLRLPTLGVDWLSNLPELRTQCAVIEDLLMGRTVNGDRLLTQMSKLAAIADTTEDELLAQITAKVAT